MRIDELNPQHQMSLNMTKWESVKQVQQFLKEKGFKRLGTGAFAEAWAKKGENTVVKISTAEDVCWLKFAQWVMKQKYNKHLPKIHSLKTYNTPEGELFISRVEMLQEVDNYYDTIDKTVGTLDDIKKVGEMLWIRALDYDGDPSTVNSQAPVMKAMSKSPLRNDPMFKGMGVPGMISRILKLYQSSPLAITVRKAHKEILKDTRCYKDLHAGNIMQRKDGTIVIMDPAAMFETSK